MSRMRTIEYSLCLWFVCFIPGVLTQSNLTSSSSSSRVMELRRVHGGACPYAAAWLATVGLHYRIKYWTDSTKMEQATFLIAQHAQYKFQFLDPDAFFVHHLSRFEHIVHKSEGFDEAKVKTLLLSTTAFSSECDAVTVAGNASYIAIVPFYGGLPPNTDKNHRVHSLGQGNSLMDPGVKILQTMATLCSCFRYFGQAVIAVAQESDRLLVEETLSTMSPVIAENTHILELSVARPANLPFHSLVWSQEYVKRTNCRRFFRSPAACARHSGRTPDHVGSAVNVTYFRQASALLEEPIKFVYYTESDQILKVRDPQTFAAISAVANDSCFVFGRRREKLDKEPLSYMEGLDVGRSCGGVGWAISWPDSAYIQPYESSSS